jgi:hypothetical protein
MQTIGIEQNGLCAYSGQQRKVQQGGENEGLNAHQRV